jgi:hypothetical protein
VNVRRLDVVICAICAVAGFVLVYSATGSVVTAALGGIPAGLLGGTLTAIMIRGRTG